jgi:DNA-binding transcriptional MerR regulator
VAIDQNLDHLHSSTEPSSDEGDGSRAYPATGDQEFLTIGEMSRESGATPRALRLYESKGLLSPRRQGATRLYGRADRGRLAQVLKAKGLGFTLAEIRQMLGSEQGEFGTLSITRRQCFDQIEMLEQRKREIETALGELRRTYSSFYARIASGAA